MPINNIPGVGPTNADIATAVAAPSAATIAAAVAAPSAATIAAAVAAPSSSTIATAVAAAVPTLTQINTSVSSNAPSPNNWTYLGNGSLVNVNTSTVSFSAYKKLRIVWKFYNGAAGAQSFGIRFNGDTASNYSLTALITSNISNGNDFNQLPSTDWMKLNYGNSRINQYAQGWMEVEDAASTSAHKQVRYVNYGDSSSLATLTKYAGEGIYRSNSAITSVTILGNGGTNTTTDALNGFQVFGAN